MPLQGLLYAGVKKAGDALRNKRKKVKGKPKGTGNALGIVGSASKAGMQSKQGTGPSVKRKPFQRAPNPGFPGKGPLAKKKTNGKRGSMVENFRTNKKAGKRAK